MRQEKDTYQRILESARDLMYASSCADAGVAAICEKAQVQEGSFYHYFESKQELTLSVIDAFYTDMKESVLDKAFDPCLPPLTRLSRFIDMIIDNQISIYEQTGHVLGCPTTLARRIGGDTGRPLIAAGDRVTVLASILDDRWELYDRACHEVVETDDLSPDQVAREVMARWNRS